MNTDVPVNPYTTNTQRDAFYNGSAVLVEKGDYIRLQYVNIAYDLASALNTQRVIKGLQIYFNASNLGLLWKANKSDLDPDFSMGFSTVKNPTNYSLGLRAKL